MAKRFVDTNKYKKPFLRGLKGAYKLLWDYLCLDCDHAGIWIVDFEIAQLYIGNDMPINYEEAIQEFNKDEIRIIPFENNKKWFIPSFIEFQYGELKSDNRAHNSVIQILKKYELLTNDNKPLVSPLQGCKDMDKDMVKDMDMEKGEKSKKIKSDFDYNFIHNEILESVMEYIQYRKDIKKPFVSQTQIETWYKKLRKISKSNIETAKTIIENGIASGYQGIFEIYEKPNYNKESTIDYKSPQQIMAEREAYDEIRKQRT